MVVVDLLALSGDVRPRLDFEKISEALRLQNCVVNILFVDIHLHDLETEVFFVKAERDLLIVEQEVEKFGLRVDEHLRVDGVEIVELPVGHNGRNDVPVFGVDLADEAGLVVLELEVDRDVLLKLFGLGAGGLLLRSRSCDQVGVVGREDELLFVPLVADPAAVFFVCILERL